MIQLSNDEIWNKNMNNIFASANINCDTYVGKVILARSVGVG